MLERTWPSYTSKCVTFPIYVYTITYFKSEAQNTFAKYCRTLGIREIKILTEVQFNTKEGTRTST